MTLKTWWCAIWSPSDKKERSALASRKFLIMMMVAGLVTIFCYTLVAMLHIYSSSIVEKGMEVVQNVAIAYFSLNVVEHGVNIYEKIKNGSGGSEGEV